MELPPTFGEATAGEFLAWFAGEVFERRRLVDPYCAELVLMRFMSTLFDVEEFYLEERSADRPLLQRQVTRLLRQAATAGGLSAPMLDYLETASVQLCWESSGLDRSAWHAETLSAEIARVPGMLYPDSMLYYKWLGRTAPPSGDVVELGCWMGLATCCLAEGLRENAKAGERRVHAFDAFVWHDWMVPFSDDVQRRSRELREGESFLDLFLHYVAPYRSLVVARPATLGDGASDMSWHGPVAVLVVDHTDRYDELEHAWRRFEPWFIDGETIVVFNQYGNARAVEVRTFCHDRSSSLIPVHKPHAAAKGFRYRA